jgi:ParB family chromosome partitioning protein
MGMDKQKQTKCIDDIICPYCKHKFDGSDACNGDMDALTAICPECDKEMEVSISVEYMATAIKD